MNSTPHRLCLAFAAAVAVLSVSLSRAQTNADYAVLVTAAIQQDPLAFVLTWPESSTQPSNDYTIYRRAPDASSWGDPIADGSAVVTLADGRRSFADTAVQPGIVYEYKIAKRLNIRAATGDYHMAYGYVLAGIGAPLVENRGTLVLVVDQTVAAPLASEIARLQDDLIGDGWSVNRLDVARTDGVVDVKARIKQVYDADPKNVKAAFLLGHVPVPYSGNFQPLPPDGHAVPGDDHRGAWPADVFYADMDGEWTDATESFVNTSNSRGTNVPGDGKFDQSYLPSDVELQLGRVDLSSLPGANAAHSFPDEIALLKAYLDKDHEFRHGRLSVGNKALISDSGDSNSGRAYSASAYRSLAPVLGAENFVIAPTQQTMAREERWLSRLAADTYQWTFGTGGGSNTSIGGLGWHGSYNDVWSTDLVDEGARGMFYLFFGSWFGDWDQPDNIMRTALITKYGLASAWSGRPHLVFHALGLGETFGACMRASQNNQTTYQNQINTFRRGVHIALMGDPTLRLNPVPSPTELRAIPRGSDVALNWKASTADVLGYHVYRSGPAGDRFTRITDTPVQSADFLDAGHANDGSIYMVRAVRLEVTPSGSYYNASDGVFAKPAAIAPGTNDEPGF
jgi:hypothetical protein